MKQNSNVPAFLTKLWTLVEDPDTNEFICWSQEGSSFLVLDEQRFAKEILPKFFKHNNMASFVRQLNMYGFRKVMHIDTGIVKQERDGPVEFQHPFFKHGQDDLLEHIKRKVSSSRPEESKIRQDDLSKILSSVQNIHGQQENMDSRLATLKRENEALWREIADLRQKHNQQQQVIKKLIQFIVTLVQSNHVLSLKRKRPLLLNSNGKKSKFIHPIFDEPVDHSKTHVNGLKNHSDITDDVIICDLTVEDSEVTEEISRDVELVEVQGDGEAAMLVESSADKEAGNSPETMCECTARSAAEFPESSGALQVNMPSVLSIEDPLKMMDSILNESGAISQNLNLLGKVELMDYLDSIDCSLEDFQAMLYGKQFSIDTDIVEETESSKENAELSAKGGKLEADNTDKQLVQYTTCPLLAFLDGCTSLTPEPESPACELGEALLEQATGDDDLLEPSLEMQEPPRSTLIRLEPLTEAEASEASLFYLCELSPDGPGVGVEAPQLEV
ncbi:heat shock factor protein 2 isoform X2 [Brienomyrus brachyistius]|uniref:heat shock factor protein 2 isoform X2 n=1 Tax=Brienomyrus brachyistius TaxID=42636 RepID=UPI0020B2E49C|nr:heat shock factor protein 2 isoform X2 [Brienomyrus brachyistius]